MQCKSLLKPVKKHIKELSQSNCDLSQPEVLTLCKRVLSHIGDHITSHLSDYTEQPLAAKWKK